MKILYQSVLILLCCYPNSSTLYHFFQDKTNLLRDFIFLLKTGSIPLQESDYIPLQLRMLACRCLVAIVGSRDTSSVSVLGRFSWLQHELGVNRGLYMGLLPCLLRSFTSFMVSQEDNMMAIEKDSNYMWIEYIMMLVSALISTPTALQSLTDNGFIALMMSIFQDLASVHRSAIRLYTETLIIQVIK